MKSSNPLICLERGTHKIILTLFYIIGLCTVAAAQNNPGIADSINRTDGHGKKHGWWIKYRDEKFKPVKKRDEAVYYEYVYFLHGRDSLIFEPVYHYSPKNRVIICKQNCPNDSGPVLLNGLYSVYRKKTMQLQGEVIYKNGVMVYWKEMVYRPEMDFLTWEFNWGCSNYLVEALYKEYLYDKPYLCDYMANDFKHGMKSKRVNLETTLPKCNFP